MTRREYIAHLTAVYRVANMSDTQHVEPWQAVDDCRTHCQAIESILRDMLTHNEYQAWLDNL